MNAVPSLRLHVTGIAKVVARMRGIPYAELIGQSRTAHIVMARQEAMFLARDLTEKSLPEIGRRFQDRDHTTVLHGVRKIAERIVAEPDYAAGMDFLRRIVRQELEPKPTADPDVVDIDAMAASLASAPPPFPIAPETAHDLARAYIAARHRRQDPPPQMPVAVVIQKDPDSVARAQLASLLRAVDELEANLYTSSEVASRLRIVQEAQKLSKALR